MLDTGLRRCDGLSGVSRGKIMMKSLIRLWLVLAFALTAHWAQAADAAAINLAGQQRMLSQRIVKSWCQIGLNVLPAVSKAQLDEAVRLFESNLQALDIATSSPEARNALAGLRAAWAPLRSGAAGVIRQSDAAQLDARAEDVLMAAERLTRVMQDQASEPVSRWVNLAGRQRMLSQRLIKVYMLQQWGVTSATLRDETERVQNEFAGALASMQQQADNNPTLRTELDNLALQWEWLRTVLATEGADSFRLIMAEGGEAILQLADQITLLYLLSAK
jgi:nitrate/nitrite-specific signal transduction histidine kinase